MTIDPADFVAQGAPTVEQVKAVWDTTPYPSTRKVAEILTHRGFSIHYRTVARYHASGWAAKDPTKQTAARKAAPIPKAAAVALDREMALIQATVEPPKDEPQPEPGAERPKKPLDPVEEAFKVRDAELMAQSENALRKLEAKRRIVTNIHLMEAASRKAGVMILVPKETAALVAAMTEAADASVSSGKAEGLAAGDNARDVTPQTIDGTATRNEQADTIANFRRKMMKTVG